MRLYNSLNKKIISLLFLCSFIYQIFFPAICIALTGGPSQPEIDSFSPIGSTDMVDLFSGDFKYNIPLFSVGDYPINLIYNSNPSMDQEASWVGLGWNINPGSLNRSLRGLPDDFDGDVVTKEFNMKENKTWGIDLGAKVKLFGINVPKSDAGSGTGIDFNLAFNLGVNSNNYKGYGVSAGLSPAISASKPGSGSLTASLGLQVSSQDGASVSAEAGISKVNKENSFGATVGSTYNTRAGLKELSLKASSEKRATVNKESVSGSFGGGATFSFGYPTFTPTINMPMDNTSFTLAGTVGGEIWGIHGNLTLSGFWSKQKLQNKVRSIKSYGYLNCSDADNSSLLDFNREKDGSYNKSMPNLAIPNFTYDLFNASGEGMGGQFRAYRGDVGILYDNLTQSGSTSLDAGIQLGFGNLFHGGVNIQDVQVNTNACKWDVDNSLKNSMEFISGNNNYFEPSCFRSPGEYTLADTIFYHKIGEEFPVRNKLLNIGNLTFCANMPALEKFSLQTGYFLNDLPAASPVFHSERMKRAQVLTYLNAEEAEVGGLDKEILNFKQDSLPYKPGCDISCNGRFRYPYDHVGFETINRTIHPAHHLSEMRITKTDGKNYVYGIPAYNNFQKEVTFACKDLSVDTIGMVSYSPGVDNNRDLNSHGIDNYFSSEQTPGYAYSYLLTGILSPDYFDRTSNGITSDDLGEAIRFNYSLINKAYQWRVPYEENCANYNGGLNAGNGSPLSVGDAKGSYTYGSKELWYVHSIESKTMIAQFYLEDREDALGVLGENGGKNTNARQKLLKEIRLYSKSDLLKYGDDAIPIKTAHFVYDYSLCKGLPNVTSSVIDNSSESYSYYTNSSNVNEGGKLTLRKVYFTYGNNTRGQLNSYQFNYASFNPNYGHRKFDRWGNYKNNSDLNIPIQNSDFPYTLQDKSMADLYATAWNLEEILLPSGGTISVNLESDDYAYVQNKRAGQMFFIESFGHVPDTAPTTCASTGNQLYDSNNGDANAFIINVGDTTNYKSKFLEGLNFIFYRVDVDLGNTSVYDYLSGYAEIDKSGNWCGTIGSDKIWIKVKTKTSKNVHPICAQGWQFLKSNYPEIAYPGSGDPGNNLGDALLGLCSSMGEIIDNISGWEGHAKDNSWSKIVNLSKSFIRLNNPNYCKYGGGSRVKSVRISDNWNNMAPSGVTTEYGQDYLYSDTTDGVVKSSGVASWEPSIGNDENPFKQPVFYTVKKPMTEDEEHYMEEPFGESFFPSPIVGYSKVTVANKFNQHIRRTATGYTTTEFYTAKDYPVILSGTPIDSRRDKSPFKFSILGSVYSYENWLVSQGYSIELNDMHGKEKSVKVYNAFGAEISSVYNYYKQTNLNGINRIDNYIDMVHSDKTIERRLAGEDVDLSFDMREQNTITTGVGCDVNTDGFIVPIGFFPLFLFFPPILPKFTDERLQFRSAVSMKVVNKCGVVDRVVATKDGSTVETKNMLWDSETGTVLLTRTQNEFDDPIFNWTYPAYWMYDNMGPSYTNEGLVLKNVTVSNGIITGGPTNLLSEGDEVLVYSQGAYMGSPAYIGKFGTNDLRLMWINAATLTSVDLKIIKSGKRNMSSLPAGTITSIVNSPINYSTSTFDASQASYIINADATEYNDKWKVDCSDRPVINCDTVEPEFCLDQFINTIINYNRNHTDNLFFKCLSDSLTVGDIFNYCNCKCNPTSINGQAPSSMPFYNPGCHKHILAQNRIWNFGANCKMHMVSLSGQGINIDSLQFIQTTGANSSQVRGYIGVNHTDSVDIFIDCITCTNSCESIANLYINPYVIGMANNWHPYKAWNYYVNRTVAPLTASRIKTDGYYSDFTPFWQYSTGWDNSGSADNNWVAKNKVTRIISTGAEVENKDALETYTAALYGYRRSLATSIASNAKYKEIANDNFEDYIFKTACTIPCYMEHWNFRNAIDSVHVFISSDQSHTGFHSLFVDRNTSASVYRDILYGSDDTLYTISTDDPATMTMHNGCLEKFSPDSGKYLFSGWVKEDGLCGLSGYTQDSVAISFIDDASIVYLKPSGPIIDGWQRYEGVFNVSASATAIIVTLYTGDNAAYFDDLRLHPYNSNMKSYVYDPRSMRLMSELDNNNYATFYEYDDEGKLVRVKKETERGVMTLKESRTTFKHQ